MKNGKVTIQVFGDSIELIPSKHLKLAIACPSCGEKADVTTKRTSRRQSVKEKALDDILDKRSTDWLLNPDGKCCGNCFNNPRTVDERVVTCSIFGVNFSKDSSCGRWTDKWDKDIDEEILLKNKK